MATGLNQLDQFPQKQLAESPNNWYCDVIFA